MSSVMRRVESSEVETLPPQSPDADTPPAPPEQPSHMPRPGELTIGWSIVTALGWILIIAVLAAAWTVSRQLGLSTWWLGPAHDQRPPYVMLIPFIAPAIILALVGNRARYVPCVGLLGAAATAAVGLGDLGRVRGVAVVELLAAAAALLFSVASFSGMYRAAGGTVDNRHNDGSDAEPTATPPSQPNSTSDHLDAVTDLAAHRAGEPTPG